MSEEYTTIPLDLDDTELLLLAKDAHEKDITLNQNITNIVSAHASKVLCEELRKLRSKVEELENELVAADETLKALGGQGSRSGCPVFTKDEARSIQKALLFWFNWDDTEEGEDFWLDIVERLEAYSPLYPGGGEHA